MKGDSELGIDPARQQHLSDEWYRRTAHLNLESSTDKGDETLRSLLGNLIGSSTSFKYFLKGLHEGSGFGDEGTMVSLPARTADIAFEDGQIETDYAVRISQVEFGEGIDIVTRMQMSRFLLYTSLAIAFHAQFVDRDLDVWDALERTMKSCSREAQFAALRPEIQRYLRQAWLD